MPGSSGRGRHGAADHRAVPSPRAPSPAHAAPVSAVDRILGLQRSSGNRSVDRLLAVSREVEAPAAPVVPTLRLGSTGTGVRSLQDRLNDLGVATPALSPDGHFGNLTYRAVQAFQLLQQLVADGIVGPKTQEALAVGGVGKASEVDGKSGGAGAAVAGATFTQSSFTRKGARFDSEYVPKGPSPAKGALTVTLRVRITFQNFTERDANREPFRGHITKAMRADFKWTEAERKAFAADFVKSVAEGWSDKHDMVLNDPTMAKHRADVKVKVEVVKSGAAHSSMTALKVPKPGAGEAAPPRFRSFVQGNTSKLEIRDPTELESFKVREKKFIRQIRGFAHDSASINDKISAQISAAAADIKSRNVKLGKVPDPDGTPRDWSLGSVGKSTQSGSEEHNTALADQRAKAVLAQLNSEVGWGDQGIAAVTGETNTTEEAKYRRVDLVIVDMAGTREVKQNTAAHEAGHMFGLGDEYVEQDAKSPGSKKFIGDESSHFGDVKAQLGADAAEEMLVQDSGSIMSKGSEVKRGHYVPFLIDLEKMTKRQWTVE